MSDTIAALATGAQISAIGILRLSGPESIAIADRLFIPDDGAPMSTHESKTLVYGALHDTDGALLDLCLCTHSRAPRSYTGEDTVEFQCHGSPVVLREALEACFSLGARQAGPGEFTKRAFLNGCMDLTAAEAISARIDAVYRALEDISAHYHAVLDYPDEDIEDFRLAAYRETYAGARKSLQRLLDSFGRGRLMNAGLPTAIIGRPNVGKSSLLNALLGYERAIVTAIPGTTRDTIEEKLRIGALTLRLIDTAGLRDSEDLAEQLGVERSRRAMEDAELVLAVIDGSEALGEEDRSILRRAEQAPHAIAILSKTDLPQQITHLDTSLPQLTLSARTGEGLDELERTIEALFPLPQVPAGEILTNARQADAVRRALGALSAAEEAMKEGLTPDIVLTETEGAMQALGELTGRSVREDVTNRIFARFCVGK